MKTLFSSPFIELDLDLPSVFRQFAETENYPELDKVYRESLKPEGFLWNFLKEHCVFEHLEGIIALRSAPTDEEGIWHDDGSRIMGFSLSLNLEPHLIEGGDLLIRPRFQFKDHEDTGAFRFNARPFGRIILFKTGSEHFEHRVTMVKKGKRLVLAGWCS